VRLRAVLLGTVFLALTGCWTIPTVTPCSVSNTEPALQLGATKKLRATKVVLVIFENEDADEVLRTDYFSTLARKGAYLSNYYAVAHPSQPNYIALISGSIDGVNGDGATRLDRAHLGQRLSSWAAYAEDYEPGCAYGAITTRWNYARRHVPFLSFADVQDDRGRICSDHIKGFPEFTAAAKRKDLPRFSLVVPNLVHDGHNASSDCGHGNRLDCAAGWLAENFDSLINDPDFARDVVLFITFDENGEAPPYLARTPNKVYTVVLGEGVNSAPIRRSYNHYDLLRTIEAVFDIEPMASGDRCAHVIGEIWKQGP